MKTEQQTLEALIAFTNYRINACQERTNFIREQMDKAETKEQLALWKKEAERHIGRIGVYQQILDYLYFFKQQPSVLFGSDNCCQE